MNRPPPFAIDTETHTFATGEMAPRVVCASWAREQGHGLVVEPHLGGTIETWLDHAIAGRVILVGCFIAYDFACILRTYPKLWPKVFAAYDAGGVSCVAIRERLLNIAADEFHFLVDANGEKKPVDYHLADLARRWLGRELDKGDDGWRLRYGELEGVPLGQWPERAVDYAIEDSISALDVYRIQEQRAAKLGYTLPTEADDVRADFALCLMSTWGARTDPQHVHRMWTDTVGQLQTIAEEIASSGLCEYKPPAPELFARAGRLEVPELKKKLAPMRAAIEKHYPGDPPRTPTGKIQTGAEVIAACRYMPLLKLAEFEGLRKIANTYLSKFFSPVVHARYLAVGAASDRTSCREPNMQNPPRSAGVRECFVARPGRVFLACDFDSQEMRTLAQSCLDICGRSQLAERYRTDPHFDPHLELGARLMRISVEEAAQRLAAGDNLIKERRQQAKISNFGRPGGLGDEKFVQFAKGWGVEMTEQLGAQHKRIWLEQWPEMRDYFAHVASLVGTASYGRQVIPQSGFVRLGVGYTDACNGYFSTLAAHASKSALWEVVRKCYADRNSYLYGSRPVFFIHDEIILETPEEAGHEAAAEMEPTMAEAMMKWTPDVPATASATLMRRWSKSAERVEQGGRLVAWEGEAR